MAIRINTNVAAMNALRNVNNTSNEFSKSITRLSTGLRITSAADDPAGLIISENFRAQITGIDQAVRNSQDGLNLAKTAEGSLDEVSKLLQDARGLAVQAGNSGVNDTASTQALQNQLTSIFSSIDRISNSTQFGNKKLLDGSAGVTGQVVDTANIAAIQLSGSITNGTTTSAVSSGNITAALVTNASRAAVSGTTTYTSTASIVARGSVIINGVSVSTDGTETLQSFVNKLNGQTSATGVVANLVTNTFGTISVQLQQQNFGSHFSVVANDNTNILGASASSSGRDAAFAITLTSGSSTVTTNFTGGRSVNDSGLRLSDANGNVILLTEKGNAALTTSAVQIGNATAGSVSFQVGANAYQNATFSINSVSSANLGTTAVAGKSLSNIDVTATGGSDEALKIIDNAVTQVSKLRGDIGSFQRNVLESNIRSLNVAKENLSATESSIRDVDQASEITNYTKLQILNQSGLSVLAQANASPQSVLNLLR